MGDDVITVPRPKEPEPEPYKVPTNDEILKKLGVRVLSTKSIKDRKGK